MAGKSAEIGAKMGIVDFGENWNEKMKGLC